MTLPVGLVVLLVALSSYAVFRFVVSIIKSYGVMLPLPDRGFRIFVCSSSLAMDVVSQILGREGLAPRWRLNSKHVKRVLMADRFTILNSADPETRAAMGNPAAALAIPVKYPVRSAENAAAWLRLHDYTATVNVLPEVPGKPEAMYYVASDAFPGWILIFRYSMLRMGKPPIEPYR